MTMTDNTKEIDLDALLALAEKATPGPWEVDSIHNEGSYGSGPDCPSGFDSYAVYAGERIIFDTLNSDAAEVSEECGEYCIHAWDEIGERNSEFVAAANPAAIISLVRRLKAAEAELAALKAQEPAAPGASACASQASEFASSAMAKDAARYRWFRNSKNNAAPIFKAITEGGVTIGLDLRCEEELDAAIDAAIAKEQGHD